MCKTLCAYFVLDNHKKSYFCRLGISTYWRSLPSLGATGRYAVFPLVLIVGEPSLGLPLFTPSSAPLGVVTATSVVMVPSLL